jgi:hypothetical protein
MPASNTPRRTPPAIALGKNLPLAFAVTLVVAIALVKAP